jgi:hypothetical protein
VLEDGDEFGWDRSMALVKFLVLGRVSDSFLTSAHKFSPGNPLGSQFTLSPFFRNDNFHLSLSIEPTCKTIPTLRPAQKPKFKHAYLLSKQMRYMTGTTFSWTIPGLAEIQRRLNIKILGGMKDDRPLLADLFVLHNLTNLGQLNKTEFYTQLAMSSVLVGVGKPRISPSPWDALCMGVPVGPLSLHISFC